MQKKLSPQRQLSYLSFMIKCMIVGFYRGKELRFSARVRAGFTRRPKREVLAPQAATSATQAGRKTGP